MFGVQQKFGFQKNLGSKKIWGPKKFGVQKNLGSKKMESHKKKLSRFG